MDLIYGCTCFGREVVGIGKVMDMVMDINFTVAVWDGAPGKSRGSSWPDK